MKHPPPNQFARRQQLYFANKVPDGTTPHAKAGLIHFGKISLQEVILQAGQIPREVTYIKNAGLFGVSPKDNGVAALVTEPAKWLANKNRLAGRPNFKRQ